MTDRVESATEQELAIVARWREEAQKNPDGVYALKHRAPFVAEQIAPLVIKGVAFSAQISYPFGGGKMNLLCHTFEDAQETADLFNDSAARWLMTHD